MNSQPDQDEVKFAKALVNPEKSVRDKTLATFRKYLASQSSFEHMEMLKLWKALYYCMWLADKQPVQLELAQRLCDMVDAFQTQQLSLLFIRMFFRIMMREWPYLDQYRVNKFYTLVRMMFRKALSMAHEASWSSDLAGALLTIIDEEALTKKPNGIRFHLADIFLSELHNVTSGDISTKDFLVALKPFQDSLLRLEDNAVFIERTAKEVYTKFTTQYAAENAVSAEEKEEEGQDKKTLFEKVNTRVLQKLLFDTASAEETPSPCRKRLYDLHKQFAARTGVSFVSESVEVLLAQEGGKKSGGKAAAAATPAGKKDKHAKAAAEKAATPAPAVAASAETKAESAKKEGKGKEKEKEKGSEKDTASSAAAAAQVATPAAKKQAKGDEKRAGKEEEEKLPKSEKKGKRPRSEEDDAEAEVPVAPVSAKKDKKEKKETPAATSTAASTPAAKNKDAAAAAATSSKKAAKVSEGSSPSAATAAAAAAPAAEAVAPPQFIASAKFAGRKPGYMFQKGKSGVGYYWDKVAEARKSKGGTPGKPSNSGKGGSSAMKAKQAATPGSSKKKTF